MAANGWSSVKEALNERRAELRLTLEMLAERTNIPYDTVKSYTSGRRKNPGKEHAIQLAIALEWDGDTRDKFLDLCRRKQPRTAMADMVAPAAVDIPIPAPLDTDLLEPAEAPSQSLGDVPPQMPSDVTPRATLREFFTVLYNHYRGRPGKLVSIAMSLLVIAGVAALALAAIFPRQVNSVSRYESVVTYANDETLCPGVTTLCQIVTGSVQGSVHMICWQDAVGINGKGNRWFYIQAPDGSEGFVHASAVSQQIHTPYCSKISWMNAVAWALGEDGQITIQSDARKGSDATSWSSQSWLFAYDAWKLGAGHTPIYSGATAQQTGEMYRGTGAWRTASSSPPRGSLVFFTDGGSGRVAVSLGNGWVEIAQSANETQMLPVFHMTIAQVELTQVGYVPPNLV